MKIAIGTSSFGSGDDLPLRMLRDAGATLVRNERGRTLTEDETIALVADVDGWIAGAEHVSRRALASSAKLRAVARVGVGLDTVDLEAARELGVAISRTPDAPTEAVAEMTIGALIALARGMPAMHRDLAAGTWKRHLGLGLRGAIVLVVGYGRIGRRVAELLRPFGSTIWVCDPAIDAATLGAGERLVSLDEGLRGAHVITLHATGGDAILDRAALAGVRRGALLLNSSRGNLIDETALATALADGTIAACWLDVFREEPYRGPLAQLPNAILTPHAATFTTQCRGRMEIEAVENLLRDLAATPERA